MKRAGSTVETLEQALAPNRAALLDHPIHQGLCSLERVRRFMSVHAFAVWDFMSLVKRLQRELTTVKLPWVPPRHPELARFINEIVLEEESDIGPSGRSRSHFDLYLEAMAEVGADDREICQFVGALQRGAEVDEALAACGAARPIRDFVSSTLRVAIEGSPLDVAVCFSFGREDLIPSMFRGFLAAAPEDATAGTFRFYLQRHMELDGDKHGELARKLVAAFVRDGDDAATARALQTASAAIHARKQLWDHALTMMPDDSPATTR